MSGNNLPRFDTPGPIKAGIDCPATHIRIHASERDDTVVEVAPSDPARDGDVQAAAETRVEFASGELVVKTPRTMLRSLFGRTPSVDVRVELPAGSRLEVKGWGDFRSEGRIGDSSISLSAGSIRVEQAGRLKAHTAAGDISVGRLEGNFEATTSAGRISLGTVEGTAELKSSNGDITVGDITGELRMKTSMGEINVDSAQADVQAKTAYGNVRVAEVAGGRVVLETAFGAVELGIRQGTAAWLDVSSRQGSVRTDLEDTTAPGPAERTVEVRARTGFGDVLVHRA